MDRTTSRRLYNEFIADVDINRPDGVLRSRDVDSYIEKALKPLIEEGKVLRRVSVNRRTGIRSTRYAYKGGKNIQDSINAILAEMPASLGYDIDPVTGNVSGTDTPPPVSVTNQGRHYYNETRERILDPRAAASIRADAMRAGGISTTDKASGYTTTLVRAGLSGETRRMRKLVDDTDAKYLAGELPSSALAEGASPAKVIERARAQVARQAKLEDAKQAAIEDEIDKHPEGRLAVRKEKARLRVAEQTPGTPEFQARASRALDARAARDKAAVEWAKRNKHDIRKGSLARQVLKADRMKTRTGRALEKSKTVAKAAIIGSIIGAISVAVSSAVKFLSQLPAIAENVHKIALKGQAYNMTEQKVREYETIEKSLRIGSGSFSSVFGGIVSTLSDVVTGSMPGAIDKVAAFLSMAGQAPIDAITEYTTGADKDPEKLFRELFNSAMRLSFQGKDTTHRSGGLDFSAALAENAQVMEKAFPGMGAILTGFGVAMKGLTKEQLEGAKNSSDIFGYVTSILSASGLISSKTATNVEHDEADKVGGAFAGLLTTLTNIKDGILTKILASLEPLASWLMLIAKGILSNDALKGRFDSVVSALDAADNEKNVASLAANTVYLRTLEASVPALAAKFGYDTPEKREDALYLFETFGRISPNIKTIEQMDDFFNYIAQEQSLQVVRENDRKLRYEIDKFTNGFAESLERPGETDMYELGSTVRVPNVRPGQLGMAASRTIQTGAFDMAAEVDKMIAKNGLMSQSMIEERLREISRGWVERETFMRENKHHKFYFRGYYEDEIENALVQYDKEHSRERAALQLLYALGKDGTPAKPGEARVYIGNLSRREERETATELTVIETIRSQMPHLLDAVLEGVVRVEGGPVEGKREYTIRLVDTRTGKEYAVKDVYNVGGGAQSLGKSNINLSGLFENYSPTQ